MFWSILMVKLTCISGSIVTLLQHRDKLFLYMLHSVLQVCIILIILINFCMKLLIFSQLIKLRSVGTRAGGLSEEKDSLTEIPNQVCRTINSTSTLPSSSFLPSLKLCWIYLVDIRG